MKKIISIVLFLCMSTMLVACGSSKNADDESGKRYNVVYKGDAYVLNDDGVLVRRLSGEGDVTMAASTDAWDPEALDASIDAENQAAEEGEKVILPEGDDGDEADDIVLEKDYGDVKIISADDGTYLESKDGKALTKSYDILVDSYNGFSKVSHQLEKFVAVDSNGIYILNTEGTVKKTLEMHNITDVKCYGSYIVYSVVGKNVNTVCGVMDTNLKISIEPTRYTDITPYFIFSTGETGEDNGKLVAKYKDTYGGEVYDFINMKGEILIDSALSFTYVDSDKVAILRGATVGFMNFEGEWITKNAIGEIS